MWCCDAFNRDRQTQEYTDQSQFASIGDSDAVVAAQALRSVTNGELRGSAPPPSFSTLQASSRGGSGNAGQASPQQSQSWMDHFGNILGGGQPKFDSVSSGLQQLYAEKLLPIERDSDFHHFHLPEIPLAFFASKPLILTVGQYSTGKTTFIQHLIGEEYPTAQIGPEPTTDKFMCICHGEQTQVIPGNALVYDQSLPFVPLSNFGNMFLSKLFAPECRTTF